MTSSAGADTYIGNELDLFAKAQRWKSYFAQQIRPYLGRRVLEVGAGIGTTTEALCGEEQESWTCLEPDSQLLDRLRKRQQAGHLPTICIPSQGCLTDLPPDSLSPDSRFDSVLYIDVLEHIEEDLQEAERAANRLAPGGHLIILAPAHNSLFTPFDAAIGHFRRYDRGLLKAAIPESLTLRRLRYLDSVGLAASLSNRLLLRQNMPTARQLWVWDRCMVPLSRAFDPLFGFQLGKSILGVWQRT